MKIKYTYRGYVDGYAEVSAAELEVFSRVMSRMQEIKDNGLYSDTPNLVLSENKVKFELQVMPDHTEIKSEERQNG